MLRIVKLSHAYGLRTVLNGVGMTLEAGRSLALVGPSGCGKTTLLHLCAGLLALQDGVLENGFAQTSIMFQQPRLLPWKTTRDNIVLGLKALGADCAERLAQAEAMAQAVGLDSVALEQFPHQLSGGMQSRVALLRALVVQPQLLLMDEPFSALDIGLRAQLHRLLLDYQRANAVAVLMITHDLMEAVRLADTLMVMAADPGRIVHVFELELPALERDEAYVHHQTARLLAEPAVRDSFGLSPLHGAKQGARISCHGQGSLAC